MQIESHKAKIQSVSPYGTANDVFQTIFAHETNLNSEDLGQVVKSLSELRKIITTTENKLLLNSVISKIATNFEGVKNIHKYQYLEFFQGLKPFYQNIQNKKEILDIVTKILTSNDYISRIISTQFITLLKDHLEDRVDVFHNLMSVALSTKSQLEIRFLYKSFLELCEASEAFSYTFLQQFRQVFEKFEIVISKKKFLVLIQKAARNISKEQNLTLLSQNLKLHLEQDLKAFQSEHKNIEMTHANIILMGNLLLYTFSHTSEIIPLVVGTFFFLIDNPIGLPSAQQDAYSLCILIIHLFKRMFKVIPTLRMVLRNEMTQLMNKVITGSHLNSSLNNMLFLEISALVDNIASKEIINEALMKISDDTKLNYILQAGGNQELFDSNYVKDLFCSRIENLTANYPSDLFTHEFMKIIKLLRVLNDQSILEIFKEIKTRIIAALKAQPIERKSTLGLVEISLLTMVSLNLRAQSTGVYPNNVYLILQDDISPILALLKTVEKDLFGELFKKVFLTILELGKMAMSTQTNPHRFENAVLENMKTIKSNLTKPVLYWMIQKTLTNNYFILCKWLIQGLTHMTKAEKILVWLDTLRNLCIICSGDNVENKTVELFKTMSSAKLIKSENSFSYQYLRCLIFLHSSFQEIRTLIHNKGSMDKPLNQIYEYVAQLKLLKDKYFIDNMSKVSLKVFLYAIQFIIALLENPIELEDNPRSLEERLELINKKIEKWISYLPFHNGEIELMKYFRNAYQKTLLSRDWNSLRITTLDDFLNFKIIVFPRAFLDLKPSFNLTMRLVNQDEFINKKTNEINANSSFRYVMDIRVHFSHLPKNFKENLTLRAEAIVDFHHNYGSPEDVIHHVSRINQSHTISPTQKHVEISFLLNFTSIGKFTFKVALNLFNKKSRIISTQTETWLINAY